MEARKEVAQSKRAVEICQAELTSMKTSCGQLEIQISEERAKLKQLEKEKKPLLNELEEYKRVKVCCCFT